MCSIGSWGEAVERKKIRAAFWALLKPWLTLALDLAALLCGLAGSWQYYAPLGLTPGRLASAVAYSTLKLFLFSPQAGLADPAPALYTLAMWLCPLCTAAAVYRLAESALRHHLGGVSRYFRSYTLVYGCHPDSLLLAGNLRRGGRLGRKLLLVTDAPLGLEERLPLERSGMVVFPLALAGEDGPALRAGLRRLHLARCAEVVLYHPDPAANLTAYLRLNDYFKGRLPGRRLDCALFCGDPAVERLALEARAAGDPLELKLFQPADLAARQLLRDHPLHKNLLSSHPPKPYAARRLGDLRPCRLLIAGLGTCGERVLVRAAELGTLDPDRKLRVTVLDRDGARKSHLLSGRYPQIGRVCELEFLSVDIRSDEARALAGTLAGSVTCAAVCFEDPSTALWAAELLGDALPGVPIGVRLDRGGALADRLSGRVFAFGGRETLLTREYVMDARLDWSAVEFNARYERAKDGVLAGETDPAARRREWDELSPEKKESCRAQAAYLDCLRDLRAYLFAPGELEALAVAFRDCRDAGAVLSMLSDPAHARLAELARLEHARWCRCMYLRGYRRGERNEGAKTHPCLIDDWEELCREHGNTVRYDLIPALYL